ncbi:MAG TPA: efflux RND transporter permease subunit [Gemmataceae bacterium]|nr:efflux RND transporter permease subunit [Gemmataceae bacterium]
MWNLASRAKPYFGAVVLTAALLTAGGIYSAMRMPSSVYPEVTFPRLAIVAKKPGLAVPNMEVMVTRPLEQAVSEVIGVERVRAKTIRGGCDISLDLAPGTDVGRAELLAWNRIGAARSLMPPDVELAVERMTPAVFPIMSVVLSGGDSPSQLRDYAFYQFAPRLKKITDVYRVNVAGGDLREIEVEVKPDDLLRVGLSAADLADQIGKGHRLEPVGRIERGSVAYSLIVNTQGETARQIEELVISTKTNQPLRVRDVANVKVLSRDRVQSVGFAGQDAVVATIFRSPGGNTLNISRDVKNLLEQQTLPSNIKATVVYDQARFVSTAIDNVRDAILIGGLFSILILLAFLRSWRATLISALAIPTTLAITFLFLHWRYGETLNLMSLGGLAVAIGLIIDDTVVVVENIARHLAPTPASGGCKPPVAAVGTGGLHPPLADPIDAASGEITGAVIGSTLTTVLVFVPLAFMAGVYGQFFASLSRALSIAVLVSMVISLTLVPVFAAKFLAGKPMPQPGPIYRLFANIYEFFLSIALRFPWVTLMLSLSAIPVGIGLYFGIPDYRSDKPGADKLIPGVQTGLMPAMDEGTFVVDYFAPTGTPLERTEEMVRTIEGILMENPDVQVYVRRTGTQLGMFATRTNTGDIQVVLRSAEDDPLSLLNKPVRPPFEEIEKDMMAQGKEAAARKYGAHFTEQQALKEGKALICAKYRRRPLKKVMEEIEDHIKEHYSEHQLQFELIQVMEDELNDLSGSNRPIEVKLFGPDYGELRKLGEEVAEMMEKKNKEKNGGLKEITSNVYAGNPDLMIEVDKVRAANLGLPVQEVERQMRAIYFGQVATQVRESAERMTDVRVRYPDNLRFGVGGFNPESVLSPWILLPGNAPPPASGSPAVSLSGLARAVPLSAVARIERIRTPDEQVRENLQPALIINAEIDESKAGLGAVVADIRRWMAEDVHLPPGYRWEIGGHYLKQQEAFYTLALVMVVAILLVFIMLAFQFRSVVLPLLIFLTQPLSLVSGLFALWITHTPLNIASYMGAILLVGLDMKNGILLVEYIQQLRGEGMELCQALLLAGRTRFRPILMTSLAAILGLFPLALGIGPGAQMQQPLAIMVIGGLTANMLFTRMVIPVGYLVWERRKLRKADRLRFAHREA